LNSDIEHNSELPKEELMDYQYLLDTQDLLCPEPVMMLHSKVAEMKSGEVVLVLATDPATERDIPKFCQFLGHSIVFQEEVDMRYRYYIKKG